MVLHIGISPASMWISLVQGLQLSPTCVPTPLVVIEGEVGVTGLVRSDDYDTSMVIFVLDRV
jgi:hypothetical protein